MGSEYEKYFEDDLNALSAEIKKSEGYSKIIDDEINRFASQPPGVTKGGQHYLIEHIKNAVTLQSQKQSLLKDKVSLKKIIMDYETKNGSNEDNDLIQKELIKLSKKLEETNKKTLNNIPSNADSADDEIEKILNEQK